MNDITFTTNFLNEFVIIIYFFKCFIHLIDRNAYIIEYLCIFLNEEETSLLREVKYGGDY